MFSRPDLYTGCDCKRYTRRHYHAKDVSVHRCPPSLRIKQWIAVLDLLRTREGRAASRVFVKVEAIDRELLRCCPPYMGELAFFAVSSSYRGQGVGKQLFQKAVEYLRKQKISSFYLFTDTSCNYGFYEHQGMQQKTKKICSMKIGDHTEEFEFYLYDYHF
ncbi:MAG: GNAT family N-acetyltransferase [Christensenellales bacterium]